jgi:hypothetical protein
MAEHLFGDVGRRELALVRRVALLEAGIQAHQAVHDVWSDRRDGWEEATFAADYFLWSLLDRENTDD